MHVIFVHIWSCTPEGSFDVHTVGSGLRSWREANGLTQKEAATQLSVPSRTYQDYERDLRSPGAEAMAGFIQAGINANWLLTGLGPMRLEELQPKPQPMKINTEALAAILDGAMRGLKGASTLEVAEFAVKMYVDALQQGLITPDGIGSGNQGNAV